jgi:hypothetical protein
MDALWLLTVLALLYAFAGGLGKPRDDARHQGTDGGAASGSVNLLHSTTDSPGGEHGHVIG